MYHGTRASFHVSQLLGSPITEWIDDQLLNLDFLAREYLGTGYSHNVDILDVLHVLYSCVSDWSK